MELACSTPVNDCITTGFNPSWESRPCGTSLHSGCRRVSGCSFQPLMGEPSLWNSSYPQWETTSKNSGLLTGSWALYTTLSHFEPVEAIPCPTMFHFPRVSKSNRILGLISFFINVAKRRLTPCFRRFSRSIALNRGQRASDAVCHFSATLPYLLGLVKVCMRESEKVRRTASFIKLLSHETNKSACITLQFNARSGVCPSLYSGCLTRAMAVTKPSTSTSQVDWLASTSATIGSNSSHFGGASGYPLWHPIAQS